MSDVEYAVHPFSGLKCEVKHLQPGDIVMTGDLYRSVTVQDTSGLGTWFAVTDVVDGTTVGAECNVHFMRYLPIVENES